MCWSCGVVSGVFEHKRKVVPSNRRSSSSRKWLGRKWLLLSHFSFNGTLRNVTFIVFLWRRKSHKLAAAQREGANNSRWSNVSTWSAEIPRTNSRSEENENSSSFLVPVVVVCVCVCYWCMFHETIKFSEQSLDWNFSSSFMGELVSTPVKWIFQAIAAFSTHGTLAKCRRFVSQLAEFSRPLGTTFRIIWCIFSLIRISAAIPFHKVVELFVDCPSLSCRNTFNKKKPVWTLCKFLFQKKALGKCFGI